MSISELIEAMLQAGAPMEAILIAVRAVEEKDAELERRRAGDRDRKRRQRAGIILDSVTVTGQSRDSHGTVTDPSLSPSPLSSPQTPQQTPRPHTHPDNIPARVKGPDKPAGVRDQTWADFVDLRKRKRAPLTETALNGICREVEKAGWPLEDALAEAVTRGWQSVKADWLSDRVPKGQGIGI